MFAKNPSRALTHGTFSGVSISGKEKQGDLAMDKWLTVEQIAEYLQMSTSSIYKMAQRGKIPAYKVGKQWRFRRE